MSIGNLFIRNSGFSSTRWVYVWTYGFFVVVITLAWAYKYLTAEGNADLPAGVVTFATLVIGAVTTQKFLQGKGEGDVESKKLAAAGARGGDPGPGDRVGG